ncbi:MAG: hypothetical protein WAS33_07400, partial [Candidatus Promineifilaceae bacterium]
MPTIAKLVVRLTLNDSQYKKGLDSAVKQSQAAEKRVSQSTQKTAQNVTNRFSGISKAIGRVGQSLSSNKLVAGIQSFGSQLTKSIPSIGKFGSMLSSGLS